MTVLLVVLVAWIGVSVPIALLLGGFLEVRERQRPGPDQSDLVPVRHDRPGAFR
ncbi:hypothetical protein [Pseudonocardia sp.]|jgi:hypothetical protein|uniref:hypothetical protein n=1 Tax=Pseudonocardia sp. TaxID=60912 RepID=UPI00261344BD|nr:hypothetical protein [Pseudonocardia sp.]MCW2719896.1 hypothetical protein [Pseudonocardia sp.]MDT7614253.1 hypothetical protein [Pseudonocardiales bacterium]